MCCINILVTCQCVGRMIRGIADFVFVSMCVCSHSKRKTACAMNTELGIDVARGSRWLCQENEVNRAKVKVTL